MGDFVECDPYQAQDSLNEHADVELMTEAVFINNKSIHKWASNNFIKYKIIIYVTSTTHFLVWLICSVNKWLDS